MDIVEENIIVAQLSDEEKGDYFTLYNIGDNKDILLMSWVGEDLGPERAGKAFKIIEETLQEDKPTTLIGDIRKLKSDWRYLIQDFIDTHIPYYKSKGVKKLIHVYPQEERTKLASFIIQANQLEFKGVTFKLFDQLDDAYSWAESN